MCPQRLHEPAQLGRRERRGRTAADIQRADRPAGRTQQVARMGDLAYQRVEIRLQQAGKALDGRADEAAVGAACRAERDADIDGHVLRPQQLRCLYRGLRGLDAQAAALRRDMVARAQELFRLGGRPALQQGARRELRRADAGQAAPGGRLAQAHGRLIIGVLQQAAARRHVGLRRAQAAAGAARFAVQRDLGRGREPDRAGVQGRNRPVTGKRLRHRLHRLLREQGELELLNGIAVVVAAQEQLHAIASRR